ncbi:MAG: hypothetical protein QNJ64_01165 [Crocosphaera sp.]|nr:hypothetical protein [Crocosphaera sp.]
MNALNTVKALRTRTALVLYTVTTRKCLTALGVSLGVAIALPNSAEAASIAYGYAYQEIRGFNITGLGDTGLTLQPVTTSRATLNTAINNGSDTNALDVTPAISAVPSQTGPANNAGFFIPDLPNYFDTQYRFNGGVADFSYADAIIGFNNGGSLAPVADATTLTNKVLNLDGEVSSDLVWAAVAESFVSLPGNQVFPGGFRTDEGNATGTFSITSTDFNVSDTRDVIFDFNYLNGSDFQLTDPTPTGAPNQNFADFQLSFVITINEVNAQGDIISTIYQSTDTNTNSANPNLNQNREADPDFDTDSFPFGLNNIGINGDVGATGQVLGFENSPTGPEFSTSLSPLTNANLYRLTIRSEEIVNTRILQGPRTPEIPEPKATLPLIGLGLLGLIRRTT